MTKVFLVLEVVLVHLFPSVNNMPLRVISMDMVSICQPQTTLLKKKVYVHLITATPKLKPIKKTSILVLK